MSLSDFLEGDMARQARPGKKCSICKNPACAEQVLAYVEGVQDGTIQHSQHYIWLNYFAPKWKVRAQNTLRNHIRLCLAIDL